MVLVPLIWGSDVSGPSDGAPQRIRQYPPSLLVRQIIDMLDIVFTGLIQHQGRVSHLESTGEAGEAVVRLSVEVPEMECPAVGDSVAINGCCLTVACEPHASDGAVRVDFDVVPRTLELTSLGRLSPGQVVNVEPALRVGDQLGGHLVQGHVDGVATVEEVEQSGDDVRVWCRVPAELSAFLVERGSITVDGVSLTVTAVEDDRFCIALIPVTRRDTTLGGIEPGMPVNIECDMIARVVARLLEARGLG